jgi:hypothetical protein
MTHVLNGDKVRLDEGKIVILFGAEHADNMGMVNSRDQNAKEVIEQHGLLSKIKGESLETSSVERLNGMANTVVTREVRGQYHDYDCTLQRNTYISMFATLMMTSLNWLCSQASAAHSIIDKQALSYGR